MKLPEFFENSFKALMDDSEYPAFMAAFDGARCFGIRINTMKIGRDEFLGLAGKPLRPIPWAPNGFYYSGEESFGKHPAYHAGLYYIQEPSAMMPAQALAPVPGEKVLDLCAAPGGKTTDLGNQMRNRGLLVTNDISPKRVKALVKNVELAGLSITLVTNETPERLAQVYPDFFDRILLDVPCSGEGMFRKDREAVQSYSRFKSAQCVAVQREIFEWAFSMLKPGGVLVYSTCTFNPEENERNIEYFVRNYQIEVDRLEPVGGFEPSRANWTESGEEGFSGGLRLWPHKAEGEGHFVCRLKKKGQKTDNAPSHPASGCTSKEAGEAFKAFKNFAEQNMNTLGEGVYHIRGTSLYRLPPFIAEIPEIKWDKAGLYLGEYSKGRFEPSQSLVMASHASDFKRVLRLDTDDERIIRYLKGETIFAQGDNGYTVVCYGNFPLGWAKQSEGTLKNLYPKGWRMM